MLDAIDVRRTLVLAIAIGVSLVALVISTLFPSVLTPTLGVGAIIGLAGCLLGAAAAVAVDAGDRTVRGPRHVDAAGANLVTVVRGPVANDDLVTWALDRVREHDGLRLVLAAAGTDVLRSRRLGESLGAALARRGHRVLYADLCDPHAAEPGAVEVVRGEMKLSQVVRFESGLSLARVGPGNSRDFALTEFPSFVARLPSDVDLLLAALPGLRQPGTLAAVAAADRVLLLVTANETSRVDLIAALDALDEAHVPGDVILLHDAVQPPAVGSSTPDLSAALGASAAGSADVDDEEGDDDEDDDDDVADDLVAGSDQSVDDVLAGGAVAFAAAPAIGPDDTAAFAPTEMAGADDAPVGDVLGGDVGASGGQEFDPIVEDPTVPFAPLTDLPPPQWASDSEGSGREDDLRVDDEVEDRWSSSSPTTPSIAAVDDDGGWGDAPVDGGAWRATADDAGGSAGGDEALVSADDTAQLAPVGAATHGQTFEPPNSDAARDPDEWLRIAAALENLANEVWAREDETQGPDPGR